MKRKEFIVRSFRLALGAGVAGFLNKPNQASSFSSVNNQESEMAQKQKFLHDWLSSLMKKMDAQLDEELDRGAAGRA